MMKMKEMSNFAILMMKRTLDINEMLIKQNHKYRKISF